MTTGFRSDLQRSYQDLRLRISLIVIAVIVGAGTVGYMILEGWSFLDSLYMTVITITTIGYGEVHPLDQDPVGRTFTIILIVLGVGSTFYALGLLFQGFLEGRIRSVLGRQRMRNEVRHQKNHFIICGYGRVGRQVVQEMSKRNMQIVVIENREQLIEELSQEGILFVPGDSTLDDVLIAAGVKEARGLVIAVPKEADNVYIALSARQLNPEISITARADSPEGRSKIIQAGADRVVCPHEIGGVRMALSTMSPNVVDFMKIVGGDAETGLRLEEIRVGQGSTLEGVSLAESPIRSELDIVVVAIKKADDRLLYNPRSDTKIRADDILIVIGTADNLEKLQGMTASPSATG